MGTPGLIIFGMVYDFLPYMIIPICTVLSGIDKRCLIGIPDSTKHRYTYHRYNRDYR